MMIAVAINPTRQTNLVIVLPHCSLNRLFHRIRSMVFAVVILDMLLTVGICSVLVGKLRNVNDIFCVSKEVQKVGAFALVVLGEYTWVH